MTKIEEVIEKIETRFDMRLFSWSKDKHSLIDFIINDPLVLEGETNG